MVREWQGNGKGMHSKGESPHRKGESVQQCSTRKWEKACRTPPVVSLTLILPPHPIKNLLCRHEKYYGMKNIDCSNSVSGATA